jgi:ABC-type antimicrobial peptide transport system permease subunit
VLFCGISIVGSLIAWGLQAASHDWSSWQGRSVSIAEIILFVVVLPGIAVVYAMPMVKRPSENRRPPAR